MRFTAERDALAAAVKRARSTIESRQTIPVLGCVHIKAADNDLRITATNLDEWISVKCAASVAAPGSTCVDANLFLAWLTAAPKGSLVDARLDDARLKTSAGRATADFGTHDANDFPVPKKEERGEEMAGSFSALSMCAPFAGVDDARYYLNGVAVNQGHVVATDGHRMCIVDVGAPKEAAAIIPNKGVRQIAQFGENARLWIGPNAWRCEEEGVVAGGKLIDGTYPDWQRIVPAAEPNGVADADDLATALAQVVMASGDRARGVKMVASDGEIALTCRSEAMTATGAVSFDGTPFEIGINGKYADVALAVFSKRIVSIAADSGQMVMSCPGLPGVRVVVMGMRI